MIKISRLYLVLCSCATVYGTSMTAGSPCPSTPTSLASYIRTYSASGCSVGIVDYTNFQFLSPASAGVPTPTAEQVFLTPNGLGFSFTYGVTVPAGPASADYANFIVQYDFDPAPALGDATLILDPPQGDVSVTEQICPGGTFTGGDCMIEATDPTPIILLVYTPDQLEDTGPLNVSNGEINLNFYLAGDNGPASFDSLQAMEDLAPLGSDTPEPGTVTLLLAGSAILITKIRRTAGRRSTS